MKQGARTQRMLVAAALAVGLVGGAWAHSSTPCGNNVSQQGKSITVKPTGISDTKNLQCAIDLAVAGGRGSVVQLTRGKFYTAQLVATNFKGTIRGEGMKATILQNGPFLPITNRATFAFSPPSAKNPWPTLLALVDGEITVRDLAIQIVGNKPIDPPWVVPDFFGPGKDAEIFSLSGAIGAAGSHVDLRVSRVSVSGEFVPEDKIFGFNVYNGILAQGGLAGSSSAALAGLYEVRDSRFTAIGYPTDVTSVKDAVVVIENNTYGDEKAKDPSGFSMVDIGDVTNTNVRIANNRIIGTHTSYVFGINVTAYGSQPNGFTDSRLFIAHNTIKGGGTAVNIDTTVPNFPLAFRGKTSCHVILNDTRAVGTRGASPRIVLGKGTKDCLVVTREAGTVNDQGTNNRVITVPWR